MLLPSNRREKKPVPASTERLYAESDAAKTELEALDRIIAEAKDDIRQSIFNLAVETEVEDDGKCFTTILEAIDDLMSDARDEIRGRKSEADEEIDNIEFRDLCLSSPVTL